MEKSYYKVTSAFLVKIILKRGDRYLLLKNLKTDPTDMAIGWETPGGHLEEGEDFEQAIKREIMEETGFAQVNVLFPVHSFLFYPGQDNSLGGVVYLAESSEEEVKLDEDEHCRYQWATLEEIDCLKGTRGLQIEFEAYQNFLTKVRTLI